ncbi:hypothetical protein MRX96_012704 [Rhipicephalus microplus]
MLRHPAATRSPRDSGTRGLPDLWATAMRGKVACGGEGCLKALSHCRQAAIRAESNMDVGFAWMLLSVVAHTTNAAARPQVDYDYVIENNQTDGDSSTQCLFDGTTYADGDEWQPDPCTTCKCLLGNSVCDSEQCPRLECRDQYVPLGQCCPVCTGDSREVLQPVTEDPETPCAESYSYNSFISFERNLRTEQHRLSHCRIPSIRCFLAQGVLLENMDRRDVLESV